VKKQQTVNNEQDTKMKAQTFLIVNRKVRQKHKLFIALYTYYLGY